MPARKRPRKRDSRTGSLLLPKRGLLTDTPAPRLVTRIYHRTPVSLFEGRVRVEDIEGWVENARISLLVKKFEYDYGRAPNNKELYGLLLEHDREFKIKELARSIYWNGVRVPIVVDADGKLLDGNRRYFATLHLLKTNPDDRQNYETINALVLPPDVDEETKRKVLIELNFIEDPKLDWSPYVKAKLVHREHELQRTPDNKELADKFGWTTTKVKEAIETMNIVNEFIAFHSADTDPADGIKRLGSAIEAEICAAECYTLFWEARNKYGAEMLRDAEFKEWFFEMMANSGFKGIQQVRPLWECWQDVSSRDELKKRSPSGVERAIIMNQARKAGIPVQDPEDADNLVMLEKYEKRLKDFAKFITGMPVSIISELSNETTEALHEALEMVLAAREAIGNSVDTDAK